MKVAVAVPRRPEPWRDRLWVRVMDAHLEPLGWPVVVASGPDGPFNRSAAINAAAREAGGWDVLVVADADTIIPAERLSRGVEAARWGSLVLPHTAFRSLSRAATYAYLDDPGLDPLRLEARWVKEMTKSSVLCVGRGLWEAVGGFDEEFVGWGFEDAAFYAACQALGGIERIEGEVAHLWHPRSPEKDVTSPLYKANAARAAAYKRLRRDPEGMRALVGLRALAEAGP